MSSVANCHELCFTLTVSRWAVKCMSVIDYNGKLEARALFASLHVHCLQLASKCFYLERPNWHGNTAMSVMHIHDRFEEFRNLRYGLSLNYIHCTIQIM